MGELPVKSRRRVVGCLLLAALFGVAAASRFLRNTADLLGTLLAIVSVANVLFAVDGIRRIRRQRRRGQI